MNEKFGEWSHALYTAIQAARLGRECLLHYIGRLQHVEKKFQAGLVSEADKESEKKIFEHLRKFFPNDEFLGEESTDDLTNVQSNTSKTKGRWIVDPLDGTTNYIHQFPVFCVSIGYEINGQIQLAVIDVPMLNEVYTAVRGCGAYVNGVPMKVSQCQSLDDAFLSTGFFGEIEEYLQEQMKIFSQIVRQSRGIRRPGAAAYDLCLVARGVFDAYWERGIKPWDAAAGILLVEEAGGTVTTYRGKKYDPYKNSIIAGTPLIAKQIAETIAPMISEKTD